MRSNPTWALQKRRNRWFLHWRVPKSIQDLPLFGGKAIYTKTLETGDLREAQRKRDLIIANFERLAAQAEEAPKRLRFNAYMDEIQQTIKQAAQRLETRILPDGEEAVTDADFVFHAFDVERAVEKGDDVLIDAIRYVVQGDPQVLDKYAVTLKEAASAFIKSEKEKAEKGLKAAAQATLSRVKHGAESLTAYLHKPDVLLKDIERRDVTLWLASLAGEKSDSTRTGYLAALSLVWEARYLLRDVDGDNPFKNARFQSVGDQQSYEPFTLEEMAAIVEKASPELKSLTKFGLVTGCRLGEIIRLQAGDFEISQGVHLIRIRKGKTASAVRAFPLPLHLWEELKECVTANLWALGNSTQVSVRWSQRFGKLKMAAIGAEGESKGFHSLRGMAITAYQRAGVPEDVTAPIVGHGTKGLTLSYGLYSSGYDYSRQLQAVEAMLASDYMSQFLKLFNK